MQRIEAYFRDELQKLDTFLLDPDLVLLRLVLDPEMERMPLRYLAGREEQADFPHLLVGLTHPFASAREWSITANGILRAELERNADALGAVGVSIPPLPNGEKPWADFIRGAEMLAESMPDNVGTILFVIAPEAIADDAAFSRSLRYFADAVHSRWLKFVLLEPRLAPRAAELATHPRVRTQTIWLSPEEIERRARGELADGASDPAARRQALTTIGLMAYGRKDYENAEAAQRQALTAALEGGEAVNKALALYNLGNTLLAAGRPEEAVDVLARAASGCAHHKLDQLAPMVYANLGVALHRAGGGEQSFRSLRVARDLFRAKGNLPGEAHVCDTLALLCHEQGRRAEAEQSWRYALSLFDRIDNPAMADVRQSGREDILAKLGHFGYGNAGL
jgi:tetratricopeptide (TPR) repeat protein